LTLQINPAIKKFLTFIPGNEVCHNRLGSPETDDSLNQVKKMFD